MRPRSGGVPYFVSNDNILPMWTRVVACQHSDFVAVKHHPDLLVRKKALYRRHHAGKRARRGAQEHTKKGKGRGARRRARALVAGKPVSRTGIAVSGVLKIFVFLLIFQQICKLCFCCFGHRNCYLKAPIAFYTFD